MLAGHLLKSCVQALLVSKDFKVRYSYPLPHSYSHSYKHSGETLLFTHSHWDTPTHSHWDAPIHTFLIHSYTHSGSTPLFTHSHSDTPTHIPVRHNFITNILSSTTSSITGTCYSWHNNQFKLHYCGNKSARSRVSGCLLLHPLYLTVFSIAPHESSRIVCTSWNPNDSSSDNNSTVSLHVVTKRYTVRCRCWQSYSTSTL